MNIDKAAKTGKPFAHPDMIGASKTTADKQFAKKCHEYACQEADLYIKTYWGSMAFENLPFDDGLYAHWLQKHDAIIDYLYKERYHN